MYLRHNFKNEKFGKFIGVSPLACVPPQTNAGNNAQIFCDEFVQNDKHPLVLIQEGVFY